MNLWMGGFMFNYYVQLSILSYFAYTLILSTKLSDIKYWGNEIGQGISFPARNHK